VYNLLGPKLNKLEPNGRFVKSLSGNLITGSELSAGADFSYLFTPKNSAEKFPPKNVGENWNFPRKKLQKIVFPKNSVENSVEITFRGKKLRKIDHGQSDLLFYRSLWQHPQSGLFDVFQFDRLRIRGPFLTSHPGENFDPRGKFCPLGVKLSVCSTLHSYKQ
jgi:hypothetical protein